MDFPILLPHTEDLIIPTHPEGVPAVLSQLATWLISGNTSKAKKILKGQHAELWFASWRQNSSKSYDSLFRKCVERYNK